MLKTPLALTAALMMAASPCAAADFPQSLELGTHRTGASAGAYFRLPLDRRGAKPASAQFGLRVSAVHSYRDGLAPAGPVYQADAVDLRLSGLSKSSLSRPTLLIAGQPVFNQNDPRLNGLSTGETVLVVIGGALVVMTVLLLSAGYTIG